MSYELPSPEAKPPRLNPKNVPEAFRHLIPLAEKYGIADDCYRDDLMQTLNLEELQECVSFLEWYDRVLDEWLAGPESYDPSPTPEYVTFTCLGMAADMAKCILKKRVASEPGQSNAR